MSGWSSVSRDLGDGGSGGGLVDDALAAENALGDRLAAVAELDDTDLPAPRNVIDGLVAKRRLRVLANNTP